MISRKTTIAFTTCLALVFSLGLNAQMHVAASGNVGIGTETPDSTVHILRNTGTAGEMMRFENNGGSYLRFKNTVSGETWFFTHENSNIVPSGPRFIINSSAVAGPTFSLSPNGDLEIQGELTTSGGLCGGGGCDMVFSPDTKIETIDEHASLMWSKSYLPAVGPTVENAPINLSQKTGGMLNELEKAHIYIEQLHSRLAQVESNQSSTPQVSALAARLDQLELENQKLKESYAQVLVLHQLQQNDYEKLRSMLVDLHLRTQSQDMLTSLDQ